MKLVADDLVAPSFRARSSRYLVLVSTTELHQDLSEDHGFAIV